MEQTDYGDEEWEGFSDNEQNVGIDNAPDQEITNEKESEVQKPKGQEPEGESPKKEKQEQKSREQKKKRNQKDQNKKDGKHNEQKPKENLKHHDKGSEIAKVPFSALENADEQETDVAAWDPLNLHPEIQLALSKLGFSRPTPVQAACIPQILHARDVIGKASTGSGKTLAFSLPILQHCIEHQTEKVDHGPVALILSPTRELAHQLSKHISQVIGYIPSANVRLALLTGGLSMHKQHRLLSGADIIIATPGRLWDLVSTGIIQVSKLRRIKFLVIDEADRLLSEGHFKELEQLLTALDRFEENDFPEEETAQSDGQDGVKRQTLVFSATFHKDLQQKLSGKSKARVATDNLLDSQQSLEYLLNRLKFHSSTESKPKFIDVNPVHQMATNLKEGILECPAMQKDLFLYTLLLYYPSHRTLIFTNSISAVRRLSLFLQTLTLPAFALHSNMSQKARLRAVERFSGSTNPSSILVATDVAARGLDIPGIDLIVHYHVPRTADAYVHRSGRTARAERSGKSVLLSAPDEVVGVARLAAKIHVSGGTAGEEEEEDQKEQEEKDVDEGDGDEHRRFDADPDKKKPETKQKQKPKQKQRQPSAPKKIPLESINLDDRLLPRIRPRVELAQKIAEHSLAREKISTEEDWLRSAAEDLGVDYDSDEFGGNGRGGRGGGRRKKQAAAGSLSKDEVGGLRAQLKGLLARKINVGVSERYLTAGRIDIGALLKGEGNQAFLGDVAGLAF